MEQNETISQQNKIRPEEQEIDLVEVVRKLWKNRKLILKVTVCFMVIGILVALFSPKVYTAGSTMVPQSGEKNMSGGLSGLASMVGINLGSMSAGEVLSPKIYPKIIASVPFQKELMNAPLTFGGIDHPVTLFEYFTEDRYQQFSLIGFIKKYTIGLPGVILGAIRGKDTTSVVRAETNSKIQFMTKDEQEVSKKLKNIITLNINDKDGYIQLSAELPEPLAVAQLAQYAQTLLQQYITEFKIEKVASNLKFVEERYNETKNDFEEKQKELARFQDRNKNFSSAMAKIEEERLTAEYTLANNVYNELAKQLEQAKIAVKETTPILTVVDPVVIPNERSKPKRALICVLFTFLGGFAGIGLVLGLPFVAEISGSAKLRRIVKE
ncbi:MULTISPECIES: Wzz/FepE/Etk N-terminal domain-containing protein [Sanguibacteroides]|uniref:Lipopolysaccharide biosynthesis protein n=1 Tax=Sanguibacteroides justesenii TaxID=1547597 RepID=A0AB34RA15_9PORP|nr:MULTISPECIES: Wzz/FepE/Etk N-terminal domain-containing protein [Sanguibacteroides]KIO46955.1 lipopolysaccharide biosynthesis protein [Sanguibacteroides justesenii]